MEYNSATGKRSKAISDRSGMEYPYREMVKEWNGSLVHVSEFEPKHPQLDPPYHKGRCYSFKKSKSYEISTTFTINPQATNDDAISNSGGTPVGVANLSLPGDFAFRTQEFQVTTNGITTTIHQYDS